MLKVVVWSQPPVPENGGPMTYHFRLQRTDGSPADPPTYRSTVLSWRRGDTIPLNADRTLRVLGVRDDDADQPPVLVVEDLPGSATRPAG
jgi:hypothetical protein